MTETDLHITDENREAVELIQLVSFSIGEEEFGVDITRVQEIIKRTDVTTVPNAPHFVEGVMNLRGRVIPVINLRARLGMERKEFDADTRIVVVELSEGTIGFIVDAVILKGSCSTHALHSGRNWRISWLALLGRRPV